MRKAQVVYAAVVSEPVVNCQRFSTWKRLLRVTPYFIRFCPNVRASSRREREDKDAYIGPLNAEEIECAEKQWVKKTQAGLSTRIAKGDFKTLSPFAYDKGIICVGGCVDPALVSYDERRAALLP